MTEMEELMWMRKKYKRGFKDVSGRNRKLNDENKNSRKRTKNYK